MTPLFWYGFAAGVGTIVAALMLAALVSRLFREPASHRAGIDEDEDDPEPGRYRTSTGMPLDIDLNDDGPIVSQVEPMSGDVIRLACPTCSGPVRETVGMVCQTCGTDYSTSPPLHIQQNLFKHGVGSATDNIYIDDVRPGDLGPPPTYPETPKEHTR
jgi:hypothetical protein